MVQNKLELFTLFLVLVVFSFSKSYCQDNSYINKAGELFFEGDIEKAITILNNIIEKDSDNARAYFNLGNFNTSIGNYDAAIESYKKAAELFPKYVESFSSPVGVYSRYYEAIDNLALMYLITGNYEEAISLSEEASKPGEDNEQPLRTNYLAYILKGDQEKGLLQYDKYKLQLKNRSNVNKDSSLVAGFIEKSLSENGLLSYLKSSLAEGSPSKGLEYLKPALDEQPDNKLFLELKNKYSNPDYMDDRTERLEKNNEYQKAVSLVQNNQFEDAEDIIDDLVDDDPDNLTYLELLATIKFTSDDPYEAIRICKRMLNLRPVAASTWYNMGNYYIRMDSIDIAEKCFTKSLEINPEYPDANSFLGTIASMKGSDYETAMGFYEREIEVNPTNEDVYYNAGKLSFDNQKYEDAINYLKKLVALNPNDYVARARLIDCYEANDDYKTALNYTIECLEYGNKHGLDKKTMNYFQKTKDKLESK